MVAPTFDVEVGDPINGLPTYVTLRGIITGMDRSTDLERRQAAVDTIKHYYRQALNRRSVIYSHRQSLATIKGYLHAVNIVSGTSNLYSNIQVLEHITPDTFEALTAKIHRSNTEIEFVDLEWTFIADINTLYGGASAQVRCPEYFKNMLSPLEMLCWQRQTFNDVILNCAAFALAALELAASKRGVIKSSLLYQIRERAFELQTKFNWVGIATISQLHDYIAEYPEKRIVVLNMANTDQTRAEFVIEGAEFDMRSGSDHRFYLYLDLMQKHYAIVRSPQQWFKKFRHSNAWRFCETCLQFYNPSQQGCLCQTPDDTPTPQPKPKKCKQCLGYYSGRACDRCPKQCPTCNAVYRLHDQARRTECHRCIVLPTKKKENLVFLSGAESDTETLIDDMAVDEEEEKETSTKGYTLWAYDIEAAIIRIPEQFTMDFVSDPDGYFIMDAGEVLTIRKEKAQHKVNLVVARDVFTNEEKIFQGDDCLEAFIQFMTTHNNGKNICVAHNGSGYDTRLIFEAACKMSRLPKLNVTAKGLKFMELKTNKTIFRDSLLHLKGSLASLARDFFGQDAQMRKGHFPHLFNTPENYNYRGIIPDRKYFDLSFVVKNQNDLDAFNLWYTERSERVWDFQEELVAYCQNDVLILARLMKAYHDILFDKFEMSPWHFATAPGYVHELIKHKLYDDLKLPDPANKEDYFNRITQLAWHEYWGVLKPEEYWFARLALRGGRTEVRKVFHEVNQEEWDSGVRIRYQDIVSMYPYVQVAFDYPVGLPRIEVYDPAYYPCPIHSIPEKGNVGRVTCDCPISVRVRSCDRELNIMQMSNCHPSVDDILNDETFFGFACVTLIPPKNLYHPVLVTWDEEAGKCVAHLNRIEAGVFTTVELKVALQHGYQLVALHRLDRYKKQKGLWSDLLKNLYIEKMANSEACPDLNEQARLVDAYETQFGMGEAVQNSFHRWANNPAKKQTFKILLNSGWGKHAQRPNMPQTETIHNDETLRLSTLFKNWENGAIDVQDYIPLHNQTMVKVMSTQKLRTNFHGAYLPAAVFVPAYGRLMLWQQLHKLGKRVLMHDTDSIVYVHHPDFYSIPEGDVWGEWSVEKFDSKNGGLRSFIGLGPKSYALKAGNGKEMFKCKGVSIKLAQEKILNYSMMRKMILGYLKEDLQITANIPQMQFVYRPGKGMITWKTLKKISFQPEMLKGELDKSSGRLYPTGYCRGCIRGYANQLGHSCLK